MDEDIHAHTLEEDIDVVRKQLKGKHKHDKQLTSKLTELTLTKNFGVSLSLEEDSCMDVKAYNGVRCSVVTLDKSSYQPRRGKWKNKGEKDKGEKRERKKKGWDRKEKLNVMAI